MVSDAWVNVNWVQTSYTKLALMLPLSVDQAAVVLSFGASSNLNLSIELQSINIVKARTSYSKHFGLPVTGLWSLWMCNEPNNLLQTTSNPMRVVFASCAQVDKPPTVAFCSPTSYHLTALSQHP